MRPFFEYIKQNYLESLIGAEIGVDIGANANEVLDGLLNIKLLYLVDPYFPYYGCLLESDQLVKKERAYKLFSERKNVKWLYHTSQYASGFVPENSLDFVYIDGDHTESGIRTDINAWFIKVKVGGIVGGHDFESREDNFVISRVVSAFCMQENKFRLTVDNSDWWFIKHA